MNTHTLIRCLFSALFSLGLLMTGPASAQGPEDDDVVEAEAAPAPSGAPVDLNTATEAQLVALPGIGPSKARAIIAYREQRTFRRVEELMRVRGIGRGTFRQLRAHITVSAAPQR
ncbi:MAG: helix-hairpin-helix domain-containing protein [Myxococcales bacterium]|nr:helix-hairpin-helix domain-containing protein [Myxococcales bacterium]